MGSILSSIGLFFLNLFDTEGFPARWYCGAVWHEEPEIGWLHIVSDLAIIGAYLTIPLVLAYFLFRRRDLPFPTLIASFALFIVSWVTVVAWISLIPRVQDLPNLEKLNAQLEAEIAERHRAEFLFRSIFAGGVGSTYRTDARRIHRMERLLDDLVQYSRVGRIQQLIGEVDIARLLDMIIDSLPQPETMTIKVQPGMPILRTLSAPLDLTFRNLIQNAIGHHNRGDGSIMVSYQDLGDYLRFSIQDDGPGISPEFHQRVFKMFETLRPRDDIEGSGMGLSRRRWKPSVDASRSRRNRARDRLLPSLGQGMLRKEIKNDNAEYFW